MRIEQIHYNAPGAGQTATRQSARRCVASPHRHGHVHELASIKFVLVELCHQFCYSNNNVYHLQDPAQPPEDLLAESSLVFDRAIVSP